MDSPKNPDLNVKSLVDTELGESFCYLPYLGICKSQHVRVNIHCRFAIELLCLSEFLYRCNTELFAFLTVLW